MTELAVDDVVTTHEEARRHEREPLLVLEPLRAFLDAHGLGAGPITPTPIGAGHSNVTFLLERDGWEGVLRRPPRGAAAALGPRRAAGGRGCCASSGPTGARVAEVLAVCDDL